jgi:hypothetical protein
MIPADRRKATGRLLTLAFASIPVLYGIFWCAMIVGTLNELWRPDFGDMRISEAFDGRTPSTSPPSPSPGCAGSSPWS